MKKLLAAIILLLCAGYASATGPASSITGQLQTPTGGAVVGGTFTFTLSQPALVSGTSSIVPATVSCYTTANGNVVGIPDPLALPIVGTNTSSGTLAAATYYTKMTYTGAGGESLPSPESQTVLSAQGTLVITAPAVQPASATGYKVYISTTSGAETLQGTVVGFGGFSQSTPLSNGSALPSSNSSTCFLYFSDVMEPTGTYYTVNLLNVNGSQMAGYPQTWCTYGGASGVINISNGAPTGNCGFNGVFYPTPILAQPPGSSQSIAGTLNTNILNSCTFNNIAYVGSGAQFISCWSGTDIGLQVNAAYASLPPSGGTIVILQGTYAFSTPIVCGTFNKPCLIVGSPYGTQLTFTPSSGAAITLNWGWGNPITQGGASGSGVKGLTMFGSGGTSIGIECSGSNNGCGVLTKLEDNYLTGFNTAIDFANATNSGYVTKILNNRIGGNTTGINLHPLGGGENIELEGNDVYQNSTGVFMGGLVDASLISNSFDGNTTRGLDIEGANVRSFGNHFEDAGLSAATNFQYVYMTCCSFRSNGDFWLDDRVSCTGAGNCTSMNTVNGSGCCVYFQAQGSYLSSGVAYSEWTHFAGSGYTNSCDVENPGGPGGQFPVICDNTGNIVGGWTGATALTGPVNVFLSTPSGACAPNGAIALNLNASNASTVLYVCFTNWTAVLVP